MPRKCCDGFLQSIVAHHDKDETCGCDLSSNFHQSHNMQQALLNLKLRKA